MSADDAADRRLVPVSSLPPSSRALFPFASFNRMQSECFDEAYGSDRSMVVSAPTGSGKTVLLELALARLWSSGGRGAAAAVYIAPLKALTTERAADWKRKLGAAYTVLELTGDTAEAADEAAVAGGRG